MEFICQECGNTYQRSPYQAKITKHCSRSCHNRAAGRASSKPWAHKIAKTHTGMKKPWTSERNKKYRLKGDQIKTWKGDAVGYIAIHNWAHRHIGLKKCCERCGEGGKLEMANRSQHYKRELGDWWTLCVTCHRALDAEFRRNGGVSRKLHRWQKKNPA